MLRPLPDPVMGNDEYYLSFEEVYNMKTSEKDRPSLSNAKKAKSLSFTPTNRHVLNVSIMVQCEECNLWRLLYSKRKLTLPEKQQLQITWKRSRIRVVYHFKNLMFLRALHVFMSLNITAMIQLSHSTTQQGLILSVSIVLVRCRTLVHQKIIPCVTVVKRKSPLSEDRLLSM